MSIASIVISLVALFLTFISYKRSIIIEKPEIFLGPDDPYGTGKLRLY